MSAALPPPFPLEPTQDERTMATLAQALSLLGFLAPLIIFLIKRQSRFVSFHALQALLWHIAYMVLIFIVGAVFFAIFTFIFVTHPAIKDSPPVGLFIIFIPLFWLVLIASSFSNLILAVVYAIKAAQGEWANYPIFGAWARRILKMGPTGG